MTLTRQKGEDWHDWHDRRMSHPSWKKWRTKILKAYGFKCAMNINLKPSPCEGVIDIHHRTYDRLGDEDFFDLIPLCRHHHEGFHSEVKALKGKRKPKKRIKGKRGLFGNNWF